MVTKTQDYTVQKVRSGDVKVFTKRQDLASGSTTYYYIENGFDDREIELESFTVIAGAKTFADIHKNVDVESNGSQMNSFNSRVGSPEETDLVRRYGGSYSNLDPNPLEDAIPGGEGGTGARANVAGAHGEGNTISIPPGNNVLVEFENVSSSDSYIAPRFVVVEK